MAEVDKREAILARLAVVIGEADGVRKCLRNSLDLSEKDRPGVVILDADEEAEDQIQDGRGRPANSSALAPVMVTMTPEIYVMAGGKAEDVGAALNALRLELIRKVLQDATLISLAKDGDIRYLGFSTGFGAGRSIEGEAGISFQFRYSIHPSKL